MQQCAVSSEKCVIPCDGDISQQLNTSEYTVYNIYGFPYFLNQESHHGELVHKSDCILCLCVCVHMHACVQIRLHEIHFIDACRCP